MKQEFSAETLALQALGYLASEEILLSRFMALSGVGVDDLRANAGRPEFLAAVLDFFLANETDLLAFCEAVEIPPEWPAAARRKLPGAEWQTST